MAASTSDTSLGAQIRDARVAAGLSLRQLAARVEHAPSYLNDIEHDRRTPSEEVLRKLASELGLDEDKLLAAAGRVGENVEKYVRSIPTAGVLFRRVSGASLSEQELQQLLTRTEQLIRKRDQPPKR